MKYILQRDVCARKLLCLSACPLAHSQPAVRNASRFRFPECHFLLPVVVKGGNGMILISMDTSGASFTVI